MALKLCWGVVLLNVISHLNFKQLIMVPIHLRPKAVSSHKITVVISSKMGNNYVHFMHNEGCIYCLYNFFFKSQKMTNANKNACIYTQFHEKKAYTCMVYISTAMLSTLNGVYNYCSPNSFISTDKCNIHCKTKL